ncbi:NAD(P)/FAD-dependent oxidoreductase [Ornithinimicrobium cavernae]|uniref:NAD(P)/FAD-dependent oxidoreductase n=1 Tax=Ornithinimicrobium cavernae TaxID=2666047 RepID=UPI000D69919D|nr:FAD-dependent oxidoreductase [Ornithinimicrobium cavernae]
MSHAFDVVVVGGGAMGGATAWHLLEAEPGLSVAVIEPDTSYAGAATSAASGGVRQLFTRPENVLMSRYTHEVIDGWADWQPPCGQAAPEEVPDLSWHANGYLFVTAPEHSDLLGVDFERQRGLGVDVLWMEPTDLAERYPLIRTADLGPAVLSPRDGWLAPSAFMDGMLRRSRRLGATLIRNRAVGFERDGRCLSGVAMESGEVVGARHVVNVAGVWGPDLSAGLGLRLPVEPMRRFDHYVESPMDFSAYPFIKDPAGLAVRPEGPGMTAALVDSSTPGGWDLSIDRTWFEGVVWPALVDRVPRADELKLISTWSGHYDQNRLDGQMILDRWDAELDNYYFATGFSGHGLMHAPAVGRALTELILHGEFQSLDLSRMGLARVLADDPYPELTVR